MCVLNPAHIHPYVKSFPPIPLRVNFGNRGAPCHVAFYVAGTSNFVATCASTLSDEGSLKVAELLVCCSLKHAMAQAQALP
jgi:hypothetical protein